VSVLLVVCDTRSEIRRLRFAAVIEAYGDALALSDSSYLLNTLRTPEDLADTVKKRIGLDDTEQVVVFNVPQPFKVGAPAKVKQWLERVRQKIYYGRALPRSSVHSLQFSERRRDPRKSA